MVYSFMFKTVAMVSTLLASLGVANAELETVKLTHPTGSSAEVFLFGAHVKSFRAVFDPDLDVLFMSNQSHLDGVNPIRGGIPVVFPNFGSGEASPATASPVSPTGPWLVSRRVPTRPSPAWPRSLWRLVTQHVRCGLSTLSLSTR